MRARARRRDVRHHRPVTGASHTLVDDSLLGWLRLARGTGIGLRDAYGAVQAAGGAAAFARGCPAGVPLTAQQRSALCAAALDAALAREVERAARGEFTLLHVDDARYPAPLRALALPPAVLAIRGALAACGGAAVAIVGSRYPTSYGLRMARELSAGLAPLGLAIVSGLARGVDGAAHAAALDASGVTVAVLGTGLDVAYPVEHDALAARIVADGGAIVTEFAPDAPPHPGHFPQRNRIIAGLADAVVVVEAARKSGSLITASCATGLDRPVLAVPGRSGDRTAEGTLQLLRDGAPMACTAVDVLVELPPGRCPGVAVPGTAAPPSAAATGRTARLLEVLPPDDALHQDELAALLEWTAEEVLAELFTLQVAGAVESLPGGLFRRPRILSQR